MSEPIKIRATVKGTEGEVRVLLPHPMEPGRRESSGPPQGAHYITAITLSLNGRAVIEAGLGTAISTNPLFAFLLNGVKAGDKLGVTWTDNKGQKGKGEATFSA
ncbi:thiosulfate oxidation carrier complex protein SoxZ [Zoogloea sp.]|uniref:thiosulfate oxidation carrier complex protein SoxZ n=1 Tax=Zoogloea sp. TaxID=49181 RepID=UPI00262EFCB3|nr:thiosulfate oxidation carrier complex protein SoxZ [Zoogloea sp.]MDD3354917.1 thiosulfate oxidation carrier complex protein SoxZ [Zoogloea sp.]